MKVILIILLLTANTAIAEDWQESEAIGGLFKTAGVNGTFVLYDVDANTHIGYDKPRAGTRYVPASTFKIINSLIGLSVGAVVSVDEVLRYHSDTKPFNPSWARDMGLRDAIAISNVPIYKELARRIGIEQMKKYIKLIDYGNNDVGQEVDTFWLDGPLRISAIEQTHVLARLAKGTLPISQQVQRDVSEIIIQNKETTTALYAKTGWQNASEPGVGWWVGWVKKNDRIYSFALNIDIKSSVDAPKRVEIGKDALKILGIL